MCHIRVAGAALLAVLGLTSADETPRLRGGASPLNTTELVPEAANSTVPEKLGALVAAEGEHHPREERHPVEEFRPEGYDCQGETDCDWGHGAEVIDKRDVESRSECARWCSESESCTGFVYKKEYKWHCWRIKHIEKSQCQRHKPHFTTCFRKEEESHAVEEFSPEDYSCEGETDCDWGHGAEVIAKRDVESRSECASWCSESKYCTGFVYKKEHKWHCWLIKHIEKSQCQRHKPHFTTCFRKEEKYDLLEASTQAMTRATRYEEEFHAMAEFRPRGYYCQGETDCDWGHGAEVIAKRDVESRRECAEWCSESESCTGFVYKKEYKWHCWLIKHIEKSQCQRHKPYFTTCFRD